MKTLIALTLMLIVLAVSGIEESASTGSSPSVKTETSESPVASSSASQNTEDVSNGVSASSQDTDPPGTGESDDTTPTTPTGNNDTTTESGNGAVPIQRMSAAISLISSFVTLYLCRSYF